MKITRNTTVAQLKEFLNNNFKAVQKADKALAESIGYASKQMKKDPKAVKKADLADLAKQVLAVLGDKVTEATTNTKPVLAENSIKKPASKKKEPEEPPKKSAKKPPVPEVATAETFPDELDMEGAVYTIAHDIKDMADLLKAFSEDEEIVFAFYWTKAQCKQFNYGDGLLPMPKSGFDNNLDLATALYVSESERVCYALSMYTEALYQIMPDAFEEIEGVRYSNGIEFQVYRATK